MKNKRLTIMLAVVIAFLLIPYLAMQFTNEVNWNISDYVIMCVLLLGTAFSIELVLRKIKTLQNRLLVCSIVLLLFCLIWIELAVGIFGSPFAGS